MAKVKKEDKHNEVEKVESKQNSQEAGDIVPEEILEAIPEEERGKVAAIIKQTMVSGVMRRSNPIAEKITSEHITQLILKSDEQDKRDREERKSERNFNLILILIALVFIGFLIVFLQKNQDLLIKIIIGIISFIGGFGFGQTKRKKD